MIMITGGAPGVGKSSLTQHLGRVLKAAGRVVDIFSEEAILNRPEFADLMEIWRQGAFPPWGWFWTRQSGIWTAAGGLGVRCSSRTPCFLSCRR
jgi:Mrp family chromosome partitioning ATPase